MQNSVDPVSPLDGISPTRLVAAIKVSPIVQGYADQYKIDVSAYFTGRTEIEIRECTRTGYRFFFPFELVGKESLYRHLQTFDWNYKAEKWEYSVALRSVKPNAAVLDVGCGEGAFLKSALSQGARVRGLELNSDAAAKAAEHGIPVSGEMIESHADQNPATYDVIASFQVLEHVPNVQSFIAGCVKALKPGGTLIFGVPNNDGFLKFADTAVLNAPPHHMGLWTRRSLSALPDIFPLELQSLEIEPLAESGWYQAVMERRYLKGRIARFFYYKLGFAQIFKNYVEENADGIAGHTVLATYRKTR